MEKINLDGFRIAHLDSDMHTVLREKRVVLGLTQQQVADRAKVALIQYQRFERGERNIMTSSFRVACSIIQALEMDISDFYNGKYVFGEKVYSSKEGLRYEKTGCLVTSRICL